MAESVPSELLNNLLSDSDNASNVECAVCLQTCIHPAELPCGHIFCYLCIKGIVNQGRRCAMCRQDIPVDYLNKPRLLKPMDPDIASQGFEDGHLWFYEGRNGWWQYDERTSLELESAYQKGERNCDLLIAGFLYIADFNGMVQYRKSDPSRRRRIKRDLATATKKGIAGLKATINSNSSEVISNEIIQNVPASNSSTLNNLSSIRIFSSGSNNSSQIVESRTQDSQILPESSSRFFVSSYRPSNSSNLNVTLSSDNYVSYRRFNLHNVIHDTLDQTTEQIEPLNLTLLNDNNFVYSDDNNDVHMENNLRRNIYRESSDIARDMNRLFDNLVNPSFTMSYFSNYGDEDSNNSSNESFPLEEIPHSDLIESSYMTPSEYDILSTLPVLPPRNRRMPRAENVRLRRDYLQN